MNLIPLPYPGISDVRVKIYTLAFRLVADTTYPSQASGSVLSVPLTDKWGKNLADGLYYVVVTAGGNKNMGKLLIFR